MMGMTDKNHFVSIVYKRQGDLYFGMPLTTSPVHFAPHGDYPHSYLYYRAWQDYVRVCFTWDASEEEVSRIMRHIVDKFYDGDAEIIGAVNK